MRFAIWWHAVSWISVKVVCRRLCRSRALFSIFHRSLAKRTSRIALEEQQQPTALLQVKLRDDPAKGGWGIEELKDAWPELQTLQGLQISGLMTMAPLAMAADDRSELFGECRQLADALGLQHCSMG